MVLATLAFFYHHLIYVAINLGRNYQKPAFRLIQDFKKCVNITALKHEFATAPCNICDIFDDIDDSLSGHGKLCITISPTTIFLSGK